MDRKAKTKVRVLFDAPESEVAAGTVRFVGRARAIDRADEGHVLWWDTWAGHCRVSEGDDFALEIDDEPPLLVQLLVAPTLLGDGKEEERAVLSDIGRRALPEGDLRALAIRVGDRVEVIAQAPPKSVRLDPLELGRSARTFHSDQVEKSAYRGSSARAHVLVSAPGKRLVVRVL